MSKIAVFTSGGDSPGMNAAVRAIVRRCCVLKVEVYAIMEGYVGMIKGEDYIKKMEWCDVSGLLSKGGTALGTSRCPEFQTKEGRICSVKNLLKLGINKLICIGGDGSLLGAHVLSTEWPEIVQMLYSEQHITEEIRDKCNKLTVAGLVGSIDNDFCGTDVTIGSTTALHRITEAVDCILTTALSHQRIFIIEVMGRNCGYLALMSGLAVGADYSFIAEKPTKDNWKEKLCRSIKRGRDLNKRHSIIIVSEGATDIDGNHISVNDVKQTLKEYLGYDARVTILGHVQRGGSPCAFDRILATSLGVNAVDHLLQSTENIVVGINGFKINFQPLLKCVENTSAISKMITLKKFDEAIEMRTPSMRSAFYASMDLVRSKMRIQTSIKEDARCVAIMNIGNSAPGMNSAVRALARLSLGKGYRVYGVMGGIKGLVNEQLKSLNWIDIDNWSNIGGSLLGTSRKQPDSYLIQISKTLEKYKIDGIFIVGGWDGYTAAITLSNNANKFGAFKIPIICIPSTISNNCPGTYVSLGCDTALNMITLSCDILKQFTIASRCKVFIMEVQGGQCGFLSSASLIVGGGHISYTPEKGITLQKILDDARMLKNRFQKTTNMALIIYGENSNKTYTSSEINDILNEEGKGVYLTKKLVLGDIQQGHVPSPRDRILGAEFAFKAFEVFEKSMKKKTVIQCGIGIRERGYTSTDLKELVNNMDFINRRPYVQEWDPILPDIYKSLL